MNELIEFPFDSRKTTDALAGIKKPALTVIDHDRPGIGLIG
jgi:hypothetical protein